MQHPLDPLSPTEIKSSVSILQEKTKSLGKVIYNTITLSEPLKKNVLQWETSKTPIERESFCILIDKTNGNVFEAIVNLSRKTITSW